MKILAVLYSDPKEGMPSQYPLKKLPELTSYPDGSSLPSPQSIDFTPGELLGSVSGELGLRKFLESAGHTLVVTSDKDGPSSTAARELEDADIVISQPFWPFYLTESLMRKAKNLKLAITAGIGSDHVDLGAAIKHSIDVVEVTWSNSISVSEHVVMMILALVRDYIHQHDIVKQGGWDIADAVARSYDLEGMHVGVLGAGRIGLSVLRRLKPFETHLHYFDQHRLPESIETELGLNYHDELISMLAACDVVSINCPLHPATENLFTTELIDQMKPGAYLINTARGKICNREAIAKALESGQLSGYAGDVWFPQPAPANHIWRSMPHNGMTPHTSGTSLSAQARYAAGVREILECFLTGRAIREEYFIVKNGSLAGAGANAYTEGNTTEGAEQLAKDT
ncbi:NAD-dependent formate dehydrogenase [Microbulbifer spongiae]|uniref:Formate dehydrogenase n=1 Tax=Microbulbifer spongiae TaxID=2944933 RepID=A0ABY9E866_9GAMM|nr:NAD-dependent formate dehydrogenase [Microbulbifer sp. MI-G]WKD48521.1 NAD-dependent formate dehydrogenase [Microbulbifer sp. MI-G]